MESRKTHLPASDPQDDALRYPLLTSPLSPLSVAPVIEISDTLLGDPNVPVNYVQRTLSSTPPLPPIQFENILREIEWTSAIPISLTTVLSIYGIFTTNLHRETVAFAALYFFFTGFGITAGYHRLWAHRSYVASKPLEYALAMMGAATVQGSIKWWARGHRAHHRYTDTDLDPYGAHHGLLWSHIGWMMVKPRRRIGVADVSDLVKDPVVQFQHRWYLELLLIFGFVIPCVIPGVLWKDYRGGFFFAGTLRCVLFHHSTFCVNSLAHFLGAAPFDDKHTPRDHFLTALVTMGEGYHNFHHQFPMDYRSAIKWYQYDPTKWFLSLCQMVGLASHLKVFPDNEIAKGQLTMQLRALRRDQDRLKWPTDSDDLPVINWESFQQQSKERPLIVISGFIHDVSSFIEDHPGGRHLISENVGRDATTAYYGGVYDHSNAAHNALAMMRVGALAGGVELESERMKSVPPSQELQILLDSEIREFSASKKFA